MRYKDNSTTLTTTQSVIIAAANIAAPLRAAKMVFHNPHATAIIYIGLAGETLSLNTTAPKGVKLKPGDTLIFDINDAPDNDITGISDTVSAPLTFYTF